MQEFRIEGATRLSDVELRAQLSPWLGRPLTMTDVDAAAAELAVLYRARGWPLVRVLAPPQDSSAGTLLLRVVEGHIQQITLRNLSPVRDDVILDAFASVKEEPVASRAALERALLLVAEMPGAAMPLLTLEAGDRTGASRLEVEVPPGPRWGGSVHADNIGSRYSGRTRFGVDVHADAVAGPADRVAVSAQGAEGGHLTDGRLEGAWQLPGEGWRAALALATSRYELGQDYAPLGATGRSRSFEVGLYHAEWRERSRTLTLRAGLVTRRITDEVALAGSSEPRRARALSAGLQYEGWGSFGDAGASTRADLALAWGHLDIEDPAQRARNLAGVATLGGWAKLNLQWIQQWQPAKQWSGTAELTVQQVLHNRNLDGSERMSIAGTGGVKAFREAVSGDDGQLLQLALQRAWDPAPGIRHALGVFIESGRVRAQVGNGQPRNGTRLSDAGLSYALQWQSVSVQAHAARTLDQPPPDIDPHQGHWRLLLQGSVAL